MSPLFLLDTKTSTVVKTMAGQAKTLRKMKESEIEKSMQTWQCIFTKIYGLDHLSQFMNYNR